MQIYIASQNPVKLKATEIAFKAIFPEQKIEVKGQETNSGVSEQPQTDAETFRGAQNRVTQIRMLQPQATYWVGIEGGIDYHEGHAEAFAWVVIQNKEFTGKARSCSFQLPWKVDKLLKKGYELGLANDMVFGQEDSKRKGGAVGSLTEGAVTRTDLYVQPVKLALIPMLKPHLFHA